MDEALVEVGKAEEGLDILDLSGFGPVKDGFDFGGVHREAFGQ